MALEFLCEELGVPYGISWRETGHSSTRTDLIGRL
jgi:hypothetical protein